MIRKCPHLVRHGKVAGDGKSIEFKDMCGLMIRKFDPDIPRVKLPFPDDCEKVPYQQGFDYIGCEVYQAVFKSTGLRNDVNPMTDMPLNSALGGASITDLELL